ncbi:MAG: diacylglycerol/lipid kinase family protein [Inquilinaceae bacterium]
MIHNATAGRPRRLAGALAELRAQGVDIRLVETNARGHATDLARAAGPGLAAVIVAGGDGTINEAVNGLVARAQAGLPPLPLGILPLGTANVLAMELGLPADARRAATALVDGAVDRIFLGRAGTRCFTMMAGVGFDARVVARVGPRLKRRLGRGAYVLQTFREWLALRSVPLAVTIDGVIHDAESAVVAKGRFYGGRFVLAADASLSDPLLRVCLFQRSGRPAALRYLLAMAAGRLTDLKDYKVIAGRTVHIEGPAGAPVQVDGDIVCGLPQDFAVVETPIPVIVPRPPTPA